ncbi:flippase [Buttiauxella agrestis]|uniref:flippase n=1 Tax=Buttiauxella agrestis TaxID=82977 RepID=UPI001561804D|nr:flippase [Buttiauxella agrestis]BCG08835.1 flippase [Buttiauxella agrestis]
MNKRLIVNIFSLLSIQGVGYIIPLLTLPYLVKTLGPYNYGVYGYTLAIIQYSILIIDFGFNLSATRKISINKDDKIYISEIFWNIFSCKLFLMIAAFILTVIWGNLDTTYSNHSFYILVIAFSIAIGNMLFPIWLFQGKEEMASVAFSNITAKLLAVPAIFIFVHTSSDLWMVVLINGLTFILAGLLGLVFIIRKKWIIWQKPSLSAMKREMQSAWHIFISTAAINIYTSSITVILGLLTSPVVVGYFVAADKIRLAIQGLIGPVSQALYPRVNYLMKENKTKAFNTIRILLRAQGGISFIISVFLFIYSGRIILELYGESYYNSIAVMKILAWMPFIIATSNVFGYQTLLVMNMAKIFSRIVLFGGVVTLIIIAPLVSYLNAAGAALTILIVELFINQLMMLEIIKKKIPIFFKSN